jgi:hypothetical protein
MLSYDFVSLDERNDFTAAVPWSGDLGSFECRLEEGQLLAVPQSHYSGTDSARQELEPHLRAWELAADMVHGLRISFRFSSARVVDRRPTAGSATLAVEALDAGAAFDEVKVTIGHSAYPAPPARPLVESPLVQALRRLVHDLRAGQRMLVIANLLLSGLEWEYRGKDRAAAAISVAPRILKKLGHLAVKNDPAERRKVEGLVAPLTEAEKHWIRAVLPELVLRTAEAAAGTQGPMLTMADLPPLTPSS